MVIYALVTDVPTNFNAWTDSEIPLRPGRYMLGPGLPIACMVGKSVP